MIGDEGIPPEGWDSPAAWLSWEAGDDIKRGITVWYDEFGQTEYQIVVRVHAWRDENSIRRIASQEIGRRWTMSDRILRIRLSEAYQVVESMTYDDLIAQGTLLILPQADL